MTWTLDHIKLNATDSEVILGQLGLSVNQMRLNCDNGGWLGWVNFRLSRGEFEGYIVN